MPSMVSSVVFVPCDDADSNEPAALQQYAFNPSDYSCSIGSSAGGDSHNDAEQQQYSHEVIGAKLLLSLIRARSRMKKKKKKNDNTPDADHRHDPDDDDADDTIVSLLEQCKTILLIRPSEKYGAGLYVTTRCCGSRNSSTMSTTATASTTASMPNIRATRLAMACGHYALRLVGDVVMFRATPTHSIISDDGGNSCNMYTDLTCDDIEIACSVTCDLRSTIIDELLVAGRDDDDDDDDDHDDDQTTSQATTTITIPEWLTDASRRNYHDAGVLARLAAVMMTDKKSSSSSEKDNNKTGGDDDYVDVEGEASDDDDDDDEEEQHDEDDDKDDDEESNTQHTFIAKTPLCLHCRRPATSLCSDCDGAYYCCDACLRVRGWSHQCLCSTWKLYTRRRTTLSTFPFLGDWVHALIARPCQLSDQPYQEYLRKTLGIVRGPTHDSSSWWRIEVTSCQSGWNGGDSPGANTIDITNRISYMDGFYPLDVDRIPPERRVVDPAIVSPTAESAKNNALGFRRLRSWHDYYTVRNIPPESPVALLLTFPLTMYHAIVEYGEVPCTVAQMMRRRVRIHVVGVEKELSCLDLFKEVAFLLPEKCAIELVFVIRPDMLPASLRDGDKKSDLTIDLTPSLRVVIAKGTYADQLDPNFDCGSGPPDMLMAFNAGLFAYPSWRSVVEFLDRSHQVVGFFTDYNEFSASQCASLGGGRARETVRMNPFRQPRAMPVLSMNLPQFCNGFSYVFNEQHLES